MTSETPTAESIRAQVEEAIKAQEDIITRANECIAGDRHTVKAARAEIRRLNLCRPRKPRAKKVADGA